MSSMKAVRIHSYGGADVLSYEDAPCPSPGEGEVLIRNHATSVNPFDCAVRAGYLAGYFSYSLPLILGTDTCGVVADVGPGVTNFKPGDSVYARGGVYRDGTYAQYVVVAATDVAAKPQSLDELHAAALPHVSLTAWQALFELGELKEGQTVLIQGAGGGVGHIAVQLAKWRGAKVIGTASRSADFARELGADEVIDYSTTPFEEVARDVDLVLDTIGGEVQARSCICLKPDGMIVSVIHEPPGELTAAHGIRSALVTSAPPIGPTLTEIAGLVDAGVLRPHVSAVLPLSEIRAAHERVEGKHTRGKLALEIAH
jgi:NADPH:quinone reductase-like Zn-dependent oxidoreductase